MLELHRAEIEQVLTELGRESGESDPALPFQGLNCRRGGGRCASEINGAEWSPPVRTYLIHTRTVPGGTGSTTILQVCKLRPRPVKAQGHRVSRLGEPGFEHSLSLPHLPAVLALSHFQSAEPFFSVSW